MRLLKKIKNFILFLMALLCGLIILCALNPSMSEQLGQNIVKIKAILSSAKGDSVNDDYGLNSNLLSTDGNQVVGYIAPTTDSIEVPKELLVKNGYVPISSLDEELEDSEADLLLNDLDKGEIGQEYDFDKEFYPYYHMLTDSNKQIYKQIYANALMCKKSFTPITPVTNNEVKSVFEAVYNDHPELIWLDTSYSSKYKKNGEVIELELKYNELANNVENAKSTFETMANNIINYCSTLTDEFEKEKYVHDSLVAKVDYLVNAAMSQSAYSALVNGKSVCAGYARAFQYIMMKMNIPCYYCTGYAGEAHAWNIVKLQEGYVNVDVTWDDTKPATYNYFNKTDGDYAKTHVRTGLSIYLPSCLNDSYSDFGDVLVTDEDEQESTGEENIPEKTEVVLNPNPIKPLTLESEHKNNNTSTDTSQSLEDETDDIDTIEEYYLECKRKMVEAGTGQKQFDILVVDDLWDSIEMIYSGDGYKKGYVDQALKELGVSNFSIQLQGQRLGNGYYRLYHNIATW